MKKLIAAIICLCGLFCGGVSTFAETVKVDFSLDTKNSSSENKTYLIYQADKEKTFDKYDVATGASTAFSTSILTSSRLPLALQKLFLFAVSSAENIEKDTFSVEENDESGFDVSFVHRGVAYWITSDKKGNIDLEKGCSYAVIGERIDGVFCIKSDFLQEEKDSTDMKNIDWDKVDFEDDKIKDYSGYKLTKSKALLSYIDGILRVSVKISWKKELKK